MLNFVDNILDVMDRVSDTRSKRLDVKPRGIRYSMKLTNYEEWYDSRVLLFNVVLEKLVGTLYTNKVDVGYINIDSITGRILVPTPWGSVGYKSWGLKSNEASILKRILLVRSESIKIPPLFDYNSEMRCWFLNFELYPSLPHAMYYLKVHPINMKEFSQQYKAYKDYAKKSVERHERRKKD